MGADHPTVRRRPSYRRAGLAAENTALREQNSLLSRLLRHASDVAWRTRIRPDIANEYVSPGLFALLGFHPEELQARPDLLISQAHPEDQARMGPLISSLATPHTFEYRLFHRDGRTVWVELRCHPVTDAEGAVVALEGVVRDISERKAAEAALRASEAQLRSLFDQSPDGLLLIRAYPDGSPPTIIGSNPAACALSGYRPEELDGLPLLAIETQPFSPAERRTALASLHRGAELRFESIYRRKDGGLLPVEVRATLLDLPAGLLMLSAVRDISQRRAAEEQIRLQAQLLNIVGQAIVAVDLEGRVIYWNPAAEAIFGYSTAEIRGRPAVEAIIFEHFREKALLAMATTFAGQPFAGEIVCQRRDGSPVPVYVSSTVYRDDTGRPAGITATITDVSDYKRVEAALRESESRYRHVVEMQNELVARYDPQSCRLIFVNEAYCRTFGRSREELLDNSYLPVILPDDRAAVASRAADFSPEQPVRVTEIEVTVADGSRRWQRWSDRAIFDDEGRLVDVVCVGHDITERVRADEELRRLNDGLERRVAVRTAELSASNRRLWAAVAERDSAAQKLAAANEQLAMSQSLLRTVVDSLADALALVGPDGRVQTANQALGALIGADPDALRGRPWASLGLPGTALIAQAAASGAVCGAREQIERAGERTAVFDAQAIPLDDAGGARLGAVVRLSDVTEQVQLEALAIANERLAANGRLAAIVAHEINTPLQAVENLLYLAGSRAGDENGYLALVRDEIRRVSAILRRLLSLSHPDAGPAGSLDCALVIDRVLVLTGTSLASRGIAVSRGLPPQLPVVPGSADQLTQVLLNLVVNAIEAMPDGGRLDIAVDVGDEGLQISVSDSGPGVAPALRERVFEPFFTTRPEGSGLGLSVARRIIVQHGGRLVVEGAPAGGARFVITLPLAGGTSAHEAHHAGTVPGQVQV